MAERRQLWDDSRKRIRQLYDQGVPLFSKTVFRRILDQLEYSRANPQPPDVVGHPVISLPTIDGHTTVEVELEIGHVWPQDRNVQPVVYYTARFSFSSAIPNPESTD